MSLIKHFNRNLLTYGRYVKFEHSVFSLPMFFAGAVVEGHGFPPVLNLFWMVVAGVGARTVAMSLNRLIDRHIDAANPRTSGRELPAGALRVTSAALVTTAGLSVYLTGAYMLGGWCLKLAWAPLVLFFLYPYMKRWTAFCHLGVGLSLGLSPLGGALAAHPESLPGLEPYLLAVFATCWVGGFDIIYATLDEAHDRMAGLNSAIVRLGRTRALMVAALTHLAAILVLFGLLWMRQAGVWQWSAAVATALLFLIEHLKRDHVDFAFFQINSVVGFFVMAASF